MSRRRAGSPTVPSPTHPRTHRLTVVEPDIEVIVDAFKLCPIDDAPCHQFRDKAAPYNVVARRNIVEWNGAEKGLYGPVWRRLGSCVGGDAIAGQFTDNCAAYREREDSSLYTNAEGELDFELNINGSAQGNKSWSNDAHGLGTSNLAGAFKARFKLEVDLQASFASSRTWTERRSLDVLYDPSATRLQWWRVVSPRLYYLEIASFDACGVRLSANEIFLEDLRDSRLVLACEAVLRHDEACHEVEPTDEAFGACNDLLIAPNSERGQACGGDDD